MQTKIGSSNNNLNSSSTLDIKKYIRLIKRKKWLITTTFLCVFLVSFIILLQYGPKPIYTASAMLQLNDTRVLSGMESRGRQQNDSKIAMIMSRPFLNSVVEKLALSLSFKNKIRNNVVDSVKIAKNYKVGKYILEHEGEKFKLLYTSVDNAIKNKIVLENTISKDYKISFSGVDLYLNKVFWNKNDKIVYNLILRQEAAEYLRKSLVARFVNPRNQTLLSISYSGSDPEFTTEILNTLVDEFVKKNIDNKKFYTREVVTILSKQLNTSKVDLDNAVQELTRFREKNPWVGLSATSINTVDGISSVESQKLKVNNKYDELELVLNRFHAAQGEEKYPILNEIISFLSAQAVATISALSSEFLVLTNERNNLLSSFAEGHPVLEENKRKMDALERKVLLTANNQKLSYKNEIKQFDSKIRTERYKIQRLPVKEMQFAELTRKRTVTDQVYSSLLVRLNQAKVADAVEVGDIIVLDYAVVPKLESRLVFFTKYFGISFTIALIVAFGFVFVSDFFDKTVRTPDELKKAIPFRVLAKIPVIGSEKEIDSEIFDGTKRVDTKLVTADYSPTAMGEEYRSLRTQILFSTNQNPIRSIFMTSLSPSDGKSLNAANLAITFAQQKIPTLLIDADLRRGVLHSSFACKKKPGLSDFLYSNADINDENIQKVIQQTHIPNLYLMTSGIPVPNPSEILGSQRGKDIIKFLSDRFGFLIVDTPPIMVTTDSVVISKYVDVGLFVVRAGKTDIDVVKNKISEYEDFQKRIFGVVLNCAETETFKDSYKYSYYNY